MKQKKVICKRCGYQEKIEKNLPDMMDWDNPRVGSVFMEKAHKKKKIINNQQFWFWR